MPWKKAVVMNLMLRMSVKTVLPSDLQQQPEDVQSTMASSWSGFKIVGDNVDYNIHASFQRSDDTAQRSFHQFHAIAVKDRVDFSALSDSAPVLSSADYDLKSLLPSEADIDIIKDEMSILMFQVRLCKNSVDTVTSDTGY